MKAWALAGLLLPSGLLIAAASGGPLAFAKIRQGAWQLRAVGESTPPRQICLSDPAELVQLHHPGVACSRFTIENTANVATIHYTCTGAGYGRTTIKVESGDLIRIESQGLMKQAPFQDTLEARRSGECGPAEARR